MKTIFNFLFLVSIPLSTLGQNSNLLPNQEPGKCYERRFYFDKKYNGEKLTAQKRTIIIIMKANKMNLKMLNKDV